MLKNGTAGSPRARCIRMAGNGRHASTEGGGVRELICARAYVRHREGARARETIIRAVRAKQRSEARQQQ